MEARCMVCGAPMGDLMSVAIEGRECCSDECADIYYHNEDEDKENKEQ